jgi:hypothetical protein
MSKNIPIWHIHFPDRLDILKHLISLDHNSTHPFLFLTTTQGERRIYSLASVQPSLVKDIPPKHLELKVGDPPLSFILRLPAQACSAIPINYGLGLSGGHAMPGLDWMNQLNSIRL